MSYALRSAVRGAGAMLAVAAVTLSACQSNREEACAGRPMGTETTTAAVPAMPPESVTTMPESTMAPGAPNDAQIAAIVLAANTADIKNGELAKDRATNPDVRTFAERMVTDHTASNQQAKDLASRLNLSPEENATSRQIAQGGDQTHDQLSKLQGAAFDRAYIDHEVEFHTTVIDALDKTLLPNTQNAQLKTLLEQSRPVFVSHLDRAKQIQKELGGGS